MSGSLLRDIGPVSTGHSAETGWRNADGRLYVANGGRTAPARVYRVNTTTDVVEQSYNFTTLGNNALVAVDNVADTMKVFYGPDSAVPARYHVRTATFVNGAQIGGEILIPKNLGVPQGLEIIGSQILYLHSMPNGDGTHRNWITVFHAVTGARLGQITVHISDESEGIAVDPATRTVYIGQKGPNKVYKMQPAYVPF
jgi:hypothetical protein